MIPKKSGAVAISTILIIGAVIAEIAVAALIASYLLGQGGLGVAIVYNASFAAQSGIDDALMKITRDKDFVPDPNPYTISIGSSVAQVRVCIDATTTNESTPCNNTSVPEGTREVTSLGTLLSKQVRMRAFLFSDPTTGSVTIQSLREIST